MRPSRTSVYSWAILLRPFGGTGCPPSSLGLPRGSGGICSPSATRPEPGSVLVQVLRAVVADILPSVWRRVAAGGIPRRPFRSWCACRTTGRLLVESLLGDAEGVYRGRHPPVEDHLGDDLGDLLLADANVKGTGDVPLDHLGTVPQDHQRSDGAQAAGAQVNGGTVVDLAVDYLVHQQHHLRSKLHHGGGRLRVIVGAVVEHPEFGSSLFQVYLFHDYFEPLVFLQVFVSGFRVVLVRGLIGTQIRVVVIVFGGQSNALTLTLSRAEREFQGLVR